MNSEDYGMLAGRYPAVVKSYDKKTRECRVSIDGITDGAEAYPLAEIEYPIGDKSKAGDFSTEISILEGDTVWVAFIGGDARYPIITGWRNPRSGNGTGWRRFHHENIEMIAEKVMNHIAHNSILLKSPSITLDGDVKITKSLSTGGNTSVSGAFSAKGGITGAGGLSFESHVHAENCCGSNTSTPK